MIWLMFITVAITEAREKQSSIVVRCILCIKRTCVYVQKVQKMCLLSGKAMLTQVIWCKKWALKQGLDVSSSSRKNCFSHYLGRYIACIICMLILIWKRRHIWRNCWGDDRIIEWFGLQGTLKIIWFQPPWHGQGHLPLDQVAQSPNQLGLECFQGGGSHSFSGQPGPGPHHPQSKEFLPSIQSKPTLFQLEAIPPCPIRPCPL